MSLASRFAQAPRSAARRLLRQFARPAREDEGAEGYVVEAYRGYGSRQQLFLMGRVLRQPGGRPAKARSDLTASLARLVRRGAAGRIVTARFGRAQQQATTDANGYFRVELRLAEPPPEHSLWHAVRLTLELPSGSEASAVGQVFVPPATARFVVISDIDDTVMVTGVAQKAKMFWRLFAQGAESRAAFPGVAALYRGLHGAEQNPILYVSRGPWSIYSMLEAFFELHAIPVGPILFLRDWGVSLKHPLPRRARGHKLELICNMLALYRDLPFVLIGDSGQHDPEVYAEIVRQHPGRVAGVYIRNVSRERRRIEAIDELAQRVLAAGSSLLLASDSIAMAEDAAARGLVPRFTIADVRAERQAESDRQATAETRVVSAGTRRETQREVAEGELERVLEERAAEPPNTLVEAESDREEHHRRPTGGEHR